jgi:hypothetical protein
MLALSNFNEKSDSSTIGLLRCGGIIYMKKFFHVLENSIIVTLFSNGPTIRTRLKI